MSSYTQHYSNFIGVDASSDPRTVARNRLAYSVNMWRDYESEQGAAIETFPGFRRLYRFSKIEELEPGFDRICGKWYYKGHNKKYLIIQRYNSVYAFEIDEINNTLGEPQEIIKNAIAPNSAVGFNCNNKLYLISNTGGSKYNQMYAISQVDHNDIKVEIVVLDSLGGAASSPFTKRDAYVPTTYYNGKPYEQRNALINNVKQINTDGGNSEPYTYSYVGESGSTTATVTICKFTLLDRNADDTTLTVNVGNKKLTKRPAAAKMTEDYYFYISVPDGNQAIGILESAVRNGEADFFPVEITHEADPTHFNTIGDLKAFSDESGMTMREAILNCTKVAIYDGRVFLTGNLKLPNTVFYSQRNITGANDPTYFGVYNYFNDGDGNNPNVDLLSLPSMLMVLKSDTVNDSSVYYHVGQSNTHSDESVRNLMPRIYLSSKGAAGIGSASTTYNTNSLSCNFLDDPVFISRRGLEAVGKENVSLERAIVHRSSNIDRLLRQEDLAGASITEWKGYLVICCNGNIYLADSRTVLQHPDGSYQYEWFYLTGVGTYEDKIDVYRYASIKEVTDNTEDIKELQSRGFVEGDVGEHIDADATISKISLGANWQIDYVEDRNGNKYPVTTYGEKRGSGRFYGAKHVLCVGELLFFTTDYDICLVNTDMRGKSIYDENGNLVREVDSDKIDYSYYSFDEIAYPSACALRLDDCDKKSLTKTTIYGTTTARLKMMPGSRCKIKGSSDGRNWEELAEAYNTRQDFADTRFDNFSFAEDEDNVLVIPEVSRAWTQRQYVFESDGTCEPFGLYELSYIYKIAGKIRYI